MHGDLDPRPDDHLVVPRPLHQQRLHHGQRHRSRVRAATAANFVTTSVIIMAKYSIFHHQSLDCLGLDGPRWSRFHSFHKVINLNVGWFLNHKSRPIPKLCVSCSQNTVDYFPILLENEERSGPTFHTYHNFIPHWTGEFKLIGHLCDWTV